MKSVQLGNEHAWRAVSPDRLWGHTLFNEYRCYFPGRTAVGLDVELWPPYSVYVKKEWSYTFAPLHTFVVWTGTTLQFL